MKTILHSIKCVACEGGLPILTQQETKELLTQVNNWELSEDQTFISKHFQFENFYQTMSFVNAVAWIANSEGHHPDLEVGYNYCLLKYTTHAVSGLTRNDFICVAKVDLLTG